MLRVRALWVPGDGWQDGADDQVHGGHIGLDAENSLIQLHGAGRLPCILTTLMVGILPPIQALQVLRTSSRPFWGGNRPFDQQQVALGIYFHDFRFWIVTRSHRNDPTCACS